MQRSLLRSIREGVAAWRRVQLSPSLNTARLPTASFSSQPTSKPNVPSGPMQDESSGGVQSAQGRTRTDATASNAQPSSAPSTSTSSPLSSATASKTASSSIAATSSISSSAAVGATTPAASTSSPSGIQLQAVSQPFGLASGAPEEFVHRKVRILRPSNTACQQGFPGVWKMEFDTTTKWLNPLMGWTSSKDTASQLINSLQFSSKEDAVAFAQREGFDWEVLKDHEPKVIRKAYADNYKWKGPPKDSKAKQRFTPNEAIKHDTQQQQQKEQTKTKEQQKA